MSRFAVTIGPELMALVRRIGDGAAGRVFDALAEHGDTLVSDARARWPVFSGASRDGLHSVTVVSSDSIRLRVSNDATKAEQAARLRGSAEPTGKSRGHYIVWQQAQTRPKATTEEYGYLIGGKPSTWKELVLDPAARTEADLLERIGNDLRRLAEED